MDEERVVIFREIFLLEFARGHHWEAPDDGVDFAEERVVRWDLSALHGGHVLVKDAHAYVEHLQSAVHAAEVRRDCGGEHNQRQVRGERSWRMQQAGVQITGSEPSQCMVCQRQAGVGMSDRGASNERSFDSGQSM